tara:strand:- start:82 stop:1302 length:1221 start_codon:yes stop_codon:yes gene_type:complete
MYYSSGWKIKKSGQPVRHLEIGTNGWSFKTGADGSDDTASTLTERFRIAGDGKIGINESANINGRLHVQHDALAENILYATRYNDQGNDKPILAITEATMTGMTGGSGLVIGNHNRDIHIGSVFDSSAAVTTSSTQGLLIKAGNGYLGIGDNVTRAAYPIDMQTTNGTLTLNLKLNKSSTTNDYAEIAFQLWSGADTGDNTFGGSGQSRPSVVLRGVNEQGSSASGAFVVGTFTGGSNNNTLLERMRVTSDGDLCINQVTNDTRLGIKQRTGNVDFITCRDVSSTLKFYVHSSGNTYNTNGNYSQISDQSLKENIVDAKSQWNDIKNIKIRNFNFTEASGYETHTQIGCVAQEVETVSPKLVTAPRADGIKTVSNSVLYMKAVKALQEAMTRIETLEAEVASLKGS